MKRLVEPSTWAGIAAAVSAIGPLFFSQPVVGAVVSIVSAAAVLLSERASEKR